MRVISKEMTTVFFVRDVKSYGKRRSSLDGDDKMKRKMHLHPDLNRVDVCKTWSKLFLVHVVHAWPSIFFFFLCFVQHIIVLILVMESSRHARLYLFRSSAFNLILVGSFREFILMMMKSSLWCLLHLHLLWLSFPSNEGDHDYNANLEPHVYLLLSLT